MLYRYQLAVLVNNKVILNSNNENILISSIGDFEWMNSKNATIYPLKALRNKR